MKRFIELLMVGLLLWYLLAVSALAMILFL